MTTDLSKSTEACLDRLDPLQELKKQLKNPFLEKSCLSLASLEEMTHLPKSTEAYLGQLDQEQEFKKQFKKPFLEEFC